MLFKRIRFGLALALMLSLLAFGMACKKGSDDDDDDVAEEGGAGAPAGIAYKPSGNEGTITGKVNLTGSAPSPQPIDMSQDANCKSKNPNAVTETLVAKDGKLEYVFVYIKDGTLTEGNKKIGTLSFPTPETEAVLDQNGCHYVPHVVGMQANQKLKILNSDPTGHNIHALPKAGSGNEEWNESQPGGAPPIIRTFKRSEILVPVKCNQHPWMKAYIAVMKNPFYAVSKEDGTFEIKGVPPGTYTIAAWQEKGGGGKGTEKTMQVTVTAKGSAAADFTFSAEELAAVISNGTSLEMMPALDIPMLMRH
ncbi:MAG TPA: hypothetical protein VF723_17545 [Pyrinomonadaceae bacterium]|jgi:hypothetical protein